MCIRIWGDLLRRLVAFPGHRSTAPQTPHPRSNASYSTGASLDVAEPSLENGGDSPARTPFSPEDLRVRFTQRAWTSILSETLYKVRTETGGILLGYRDGNDWLVTESIDPGPNSTFQVAFFEYDQAYVNHLANRVVHLYERPLEVIGLWHRHPGSFDRFSDTDDGTNAAYAQLSSWGSISGLINIDPTPRLTLFHVDGNTCVYRRIPYRVLDWEESLAAAPMCSPEDLTRAIEEENRRALSSTARVTSAAPALKLAELDRLWRDAVGRAALDSQALAAHTAEWDTSIWEDEDLERAVGLIENGAAALSARGIDLELSIDGDRHLLLSTTDGHDKLTLGIIGIIGKKRDSNGELAFVLHHPDTDATAALTTDTIGKVLAASDTTRPVTTVVI